MRTLRLITAICAFSMAIVGAESPYVGTWKLDTSGTSLRNS
jgi:hypothetical protein